jgi:hypothetical protein
MSWLRQHVYMILAGIKMTLLALAYSKGRKDANSKRDADEMENAYNMERRRNEIDRGVDGSTARDELRKNWKRK